MARARGNSTTKDNQAIQRAGALLAKLQASYEPMIEPHHRLYKKAMAAMVARSTHKTMVFETPSDHETFDAAATRNGYFALSAKMQRVCMQLDRTVKRIIRLSPKTLSDWAIVAKAYHYRFEDCETTSLDPKQDFSLRFALAHGIKPIAPWHKSEAA